MLLKDLIGKEKIELLRVFCNGWITREEFEEKVKDLNIKENKEYATPQRVFKKGH